MVNICYNSGIKNTYPRNTTLAFCIPGNRSEGFFSGILPSTGWASQADRDGVTCIPPINGPK